MKSFVAFALFVAVASAASLPTYSADGAAEIKYYSSENIGLPDGYKFGYETSNGIKQQEEGNLENVGTSDEALTVRGSYAYIDPLGVAHSLSYIADKFGFQPISEDLPKSV